MADSSIKKILLEAFTELRTSYGSFSRVGSRMVVLSTDSQYRSELNAIRLRVHLHYLVSRST